MVDRTDVLRAGARARRAGTLTRRTALGLGLSALVAGTAACVSGTGGAGGGRGAAASPGPATGASSTSASATPGPTVTGPRPLPSKEAVAVVGLSIPAIDLTADRLERLALLPDGSLAAPEDPELAGWYADGPVPGDIGPAVIAGHLDSTRGPAVFIRLPQLRAGDEIDVRLSTGRTVRFTVDRSIRTAKRGFPTEEVYGPVPDAQLRLITCDGPYIKSAGGYQDNTVVFATRRS